MAAGISDSAPYRPQVRLKVRLVSASTGNRILMNDTVVVNPLGAPDDAVAVAPPPAFSFATFDTLTMNPPQTTLALKTGLDLGANAVADLMR